MLQYVCDNSPEVRQAAAYGLGVMAQFGGDNYRPFLTGTCAHSALLPQNVSRCAAASSRPPHRFRKRSGPISALVSPPSPIYSTTLFS